MKWMSYKHGEYKNENIKKESGSNKCFYVTGL